ncbi:MAG: 6-carboxytetrahydropterin synthase [Bacteroidales bacterium]
MKYILKKKFTFEAAHRLIKNYTGKCTNNHGHSYSVVLMLEGTGLDEKDMLIDFVETKQLKQWIDTYLDHASILWENDPMIPMLKQLDQKLFICKKSPTSEHIAELIMQEAINFFENSKLKIHAIEINETCTSGITLYR